MLNAQTLRRVYGEIEGTKGFVPSDFIVNSQTEEKTGVTFLTITYAFDDRFKLYASIQRRMEQKGEYGSDFKIPLRALPGTACDQEEKTIWGIDELLREIGRWIGRIADDLEAAPIARRITEQRVEIEKISERIDGQAQGFFSREEAESLRSELRNVQIKLEAAINASTVEKDEKARQISELRTEIEALSQQLESLSKPGFRVRIGTFPA